jgi:hypothetical protein
MVRCPLRAVPTDNTSGAESPAKEVLRKNRRRDQVDGEGREATEAGEGEEAALSFMLAGCGKDERITSLNADRD